MEMKQKEKEPQEIREWVLVVEDSQGCSCWQATRGTTVTLLGRHSCLGMTALFGVLVVGCNTNVADSHRMLSSGEMSRLFLAPAPIISSRGVVLKSIQ
jgi:hypothetical protein